MLDLAFAIRRSDLDEVMRCSGRLQRSLEELRLCRQLRRRGMEVHYVSSIELLDTGGGAADAVGRRPLRSSVGAWVRLLLRHPRYGLRLAGRRRFGRRLAWALTRTLEISVAVVLLALLSPLVLAIVLAIRFDSRGPVLFRQVRLGRGAHVCSANRRCPALDGDHQQRRSDVANRKPPVGGQHSLVCTCWEIGSPNARQRQPRAIFQSGLIQR